MNRPLLSTALLAGALALPGACVHADTAPSSAPMPAGVTTLARAAVGARDNGNLPFAVIDKKGAQLYVFDAGGRLQASSPVLLGLAIGDESVPDIGTRKLSDIRPEERTTPAGRFVSEPGRNLQGDDIVWVDYDAAVSMHRVRTNNRAERRLERLASPTVEDNRISYGCINVPAAFYDAHVKPALGNSHGIVYVLPETRPASTSFGFLRPTAAD